VHSCMADLQALLGREKETVEWLRNKTATIGNLHELYLSADNALLRFRKQFGMSVQLTWPVTHESGGGRILWLYVGGLIEWRKGVINASYFLCVAADVSGGSKKHVLRKYHFDYAAPVGTRNRPHPVFHLQYPGTLSSELAPELDDGHMDAYFEEPRVFCSPMSLALVMHMAFWEFPDECTDRVRKDGYWLNSILTRDQQCMWLPFHRKCVTLMNNRKILLDAAYGI